MRFPIAEGSVTIERLDTELKSTFPQYQIKLKGKAQLQVQETKKAGASVVLRKRTIFVVGNFPTGWGRFLFVFCVLVLGFIITYGVYAFVFRRKMKQVEKNIARFVKARYVEGKSLEEAQSAKG